MKATVLYRTASILLIVAAAGNTYAVVRFWQAAGAMNTVPLPEDHRLSYGPVVLALGVFCSLCSVWCISCLASGWAGKDDSSSHWCFGMGAFRVSTPWGLRELQ